jgi:hypothetical protein
MPAPRQEDSVKAVHKSDGPLPEERSLLRKLIGAAIRGFVIFMIFRFIQNGNWPFIFI